MHGQEVGWANIDAQDLIRHLAICLSVRDDLGAETPVEDVIHRKSGLAYKG